MNVLLHLGSLHPFETAMLMLLAFGPVLVAAVVVAVLRRKEAAQERERG